ILYYRGTWYGLSQKEGEFDPARAQNRSYRHCYAAASRAELQALLPIRLRWLRLQAVGLLRRLPLARRLKEKLRRHLRAVPRKPVRPGDRNPQLIEEGYAGYTIIYYRGSWYALYQDAGPFDPAAAQPPAGRFYSAATEQVLPALLPAGPRWLRRLPGGPQVLHLLYA